MSPEATSEPTLPVTANAYQKNLIPGPSCICNAGFVVTLNSQGSAILAATYLSGTPSPCNAGTTFTAIALDSHSNVFLGGESGSADFLLLDPFTSHLEYSNYVWDMVLAE
jgi:hypothetical protein